MQSTTYTTIHFKKWNVGGEQLNNFDNLKHWAFPEKIETPLLMISMEISRGKSESSQNSRGVCQNLREKRGFPKGLMQKKWKIPGGS